MKTHKLGFTSWIGVAVSFAGLLIELIQRSIMEKEQQEYISSEVQKQLDARLGKTKN